jgi:hypothetical protein
VPRLRDCSQEEVTEKVGRVLDWQAQGQSHRNQAMVERRNLVDRGTLKAPRQSLLLSSPPSGSLFMCLTASSSRNSSVRMSSRFLPALAKPWVTEGSKESRSRVMSRQTSRSVIVVGSRSRMASRSRT